MTNAPIVPESVAAELAAGQSYFREHLTHAHERIAELERRVTTAESNATMLGLSKAAEELAEARTERRQIVHDIAVHLRWEELRAAGVDVFPAGGCSGEHNVADCDARLGAIADVGAAAIREAHEWIQIPTEAKE